MADIWVQKRGFPNRFMDRKEFETNFKDSIIGNQLLFCRYCESYVSRNSKHCRSCNRCTEGFDHHCRWVNNCISELNYKQFFVCLIFLGIFIY